MKFFALELKNRYNIRCYKKNDKDKLYSFILSVDNKLIYDDLAVNRFLCQKYRFTIQELRIIKRYLRLYCDLVDLDKILEEGN